MRVQAVLIPKDKFTQAAANSWIKKHGYKLTFYGKKVHITDKYYRYRQEKPNKGTYAIKRLKNGVKLIMMD